MMVMGEGRDMRQENDKSVLDLRRMKQKVCKGDGEEGGWGGRDAKVQTWVA